MEDMTTTPESTEKNTAELLKKSGTPAFSLMQAVKRRFFAMRNGGLAEQMAAGGIKTKINFGLNLPQIKEIALMVTEGTLPDNPHRPTDAERTELARMLWQNATTRESRLIAPMLFNAEEITREEAAAMLRECATTEEADVLCHRLLRKHPEAMALAADLFDNAEGELQQYTALRLMMNLLMFGTSDENMKEIARYATMTQKSESPMVARLSAQIGQELEQWQ